MTQEWEISGAAWQDIKARPPRLSDERPVAELAATQPWGYPYAAAVSYPHPARRPPPPPPLVLSGHAASLTPVLIGHAARRPSHPYLGKP